MKELTFADLMAIDYWMDKNFHEAVIASKLGMRTAELKFSSTPDRLRWAADVVNDKLRNNGR